MVEKTENAMEEKIIVGEYALLKDQMDLKDWMNLVKEKMKFIEERLMKMKDCEAEIE